MALDRIQKHIFSERNLSAGDYIAFSGMMESLFQNEIYSALDEYGIPFATTDKCPFLKNAKSLNEAITSLQKRDISALQLEPFEKDLLLSVQKSLT
jgi:hypothetical protein